jgi:outer membrane protein assembly factor BamB
MSICAVLSLLLSGLSWGDDKKPGATVNWPQFRGANASGVADGKTPTKWDATKNDGIKWKTPIPGLGHSSPIIWGDKLYITTAISGQKDASLRVGLYGDVAPVQDDTEHSYHLYCIDKNSGKIIWDKEVHKAVPMIKRHTKATHANSTPVTDGKNVIAFFGSEGLYCYSTDGELKWKKDLGKLDAGWYVMKDAQWEYGSSPIIHDGKVIVLCDIQEGSFIAALDLESGSEVWRTSRDEVPTWGTPTIVESGGRTQAVVNGYHTIGGYDAKTGQEIWKMKGGGDIPVPTPVLAHDLIFITNAHGPAAPLYAIKTSAKGDISLAEKETSNEHIAWANLRIGNYMQTPIVYGNYLYLCRDNGIMACYDARTGKTISKRRLGDGSTGFTGSPVAADGKIYYSGETGDVYVLKAFDDTASVPEGTQLEAEILATNPMGEVLMSTPAISEGRLYFRGQNQVFCVE